MALDWLGAVQGGLGGAGSGAALGSTVAPGIGTAIGAGAGGLAGLLAGLFGGGKKERFIQPPRTKQQMDLINLLLGQGSQMLQNPYAGFEPIARDTERRFQQQIIPSLAERFSSMGDNALSSPSFATQVGQATTGLGEALASLQAQYGQQNQRNALSMLSLGMSPLLENYYQPRSPGFGEQAFGGALSALPQLYQAQLLQNALSGLQR